MPERSDEILDMQHQLQMRLWAGEYWEQGHPIVRMLADLMLQTAMHPNVLHLDNKEHTLEPGETV